MNSDKILALNRLREEELKRRSEIRQRIADWRERQGTMQPEAESEQASGHLLGRFARLATLFLS